jgi:hypothetical protein
MSVGFFMGIKDSYIEQAQHLADQYIGAANRVLTELGAPPYLESTKPPDVYENHLFGRSALDHDSARLLGRLGKVAREIMGAEHLWLLAHNPYRVAFLPVEFKKPLLTDYHETICGEDLPIAIGSSPVLFRECQVFADHLGVPLNHGLLEDSTAARINDYLPLGEGDKVDPNTDQRTTWLLVFEGARLSIEHNIALSLAG